MFPTAWVLVYILSAAHLSAIAIIAVTAGREVGDTESPPIVRNTPLVQI